MMQIVTHTEEEVGVILTHRELELFYNFLGYLVPSRCTPEQDESTYFAIKHFYETSDTFPLLYEMFANDDNGVKRKVYSVYFKEA